jgi:hypothetical protein
MRTLDSQSQLLTFLILALLNVALVLVNQFPLFALLLRIKDPRRLPGKQAATRRVHLLTMHRRHCIHAGTRWLPATHTGGSLSVYDFSGVVDPSIEPDLASVSNICSLSCVPRLLVLFVNINIVVETFWFSFLKAHHPMRLLGSVLSARTIVGLARRS